MPSEGLHTGHIFANKHNTLLQWLAIYCCSVCFTAYIDASSRDNDIGHSREVPLIFSCTGTINASCSGHKYTALHSSDTER